MYDTHNASWKSPPNYLDIYFSAKWQLGVLFERTYPLVKSWILEWLPTLPSLEGHCDGGGGGGGQRVWVFGLGQKCVVRGVDLHAHVWSHVSLLMKKITHQGHFFTQKELAWQISVDSEQLEKSLQNRHLWLACMLPFNNCFLLLRREEPARFSF